MRERKLFLHIGSHKTGTTSIQAGLFKNPDRLSEFGFSFYSTGPFPTVHAYLYPPNMAEFSRIGHHVRDKGLLADELAACPSQHVITSSENFSFVFEPGELRSLAKSLRKQFQTVKIVCYLRRQDKHAISHHQEGAKPRRKAEEMLYGHAATALPEDIPGVQSYLDYARRIGAWADAFGDENMIVRIFETANLKNGDAFDDFLDAVGLPSEGFERAPMMNVSMGKTKTKVGHVMNTVIENERLKDIILGTLRDDQKLLPSRQGAEEFYAQFRAGNRALNERLGISRHEYLFDEDFSAYPESDDENWSEEEANQTIRALLELFVDQFEPMNADEYREAALACERAGLLVSAERLMSMAKVFRPHGPAILSKLEEYRRRIAD